METIFDYNPTEAELERFGGKAIEYLRNKGIDIYRNNDNRYYHLFLLFNGRGDKEKTKYYLSLIQDRDILKVFMEDF